MHNTRNLWTKLRTPVWPTRHIIKVLTFILSLFSLFSHRHLQNTKESLMLLNNGTTVSSCLETSTKFEFTKLNKFKSYLLKRAYYTYKSIKQLSHIDSWHKEVFIALCGKHNVQIQQIRSNQRINLCLKCIKCWLKIVKNAAVSLCKATILPPSPSVEWNDPFSSRNSCQWWILSHQYINIKSYQSQACNKTLVLVLNSFIITEDSDKNIKFSIKFRYQTLKTTACGMCTCLFHKFSFEKCSYSTFTGYTCIASEIN